MCLSYRGTSWDVRGRYSSHSSSLLFPAPLLRYLPNLLDTQMDAIEYIIANYQT